jgi:hypothetical protein
VIYTNLQINSSSVFVPKKKKEVVLTPFTSQQQKWGKTTAN